MWFFSRQGFVSIVRHSGKPEVLIVRSRFRGHIEKIFPNAVIEEDPTRDYRFRAELPAKEVAKAIMVPNSIVRRWRNLHFACS